MIVLLDTGILGLITNPFSSDRSNRCINWMYGLLSRGVQVYSSDICDYEVRRGLTLAQMQSRGGDGIQRLDELRKVIDFLSITPDVLNRASSIWAKAQTESRLNASTTDINFDIILCSQWEF